MLLCNSWSVTMVLCWMENTSDVTEARLFCERKDPPQECNPTNCTWLLLTLECRCVQIMVTTVPIIVFFYPEGCHRVASFFKKLFDGFLGDSAK